MRLFILGATGHTGRELTQLGLARGHQVTAFVRSPDKIQARPPGLSVIAGNPLEPAQLRAALPGHDAVLSSLGPGFPEAFRPSTLMARSAASAVQAMREAGVERLAIASAAVLFPTPGRYYAFFRWLLREHARDLSGMENVVRQSGLAWTIGRPPRLIAARDAHYASYGDDLPAGNRSVSFRAFATFMLDCVEQGKHVREVVGVGRG
jgi:putative NADH-flavin reductase